MSAVQRTRGLVAAVLLVALTGGSAVAADRLPQKKASPSCDQAALVTYRAFFDARRAATAAFHDALATADEAFRVTQLSGTKAQRKAAPQLRQQARAAARVDYDRALAALGAVPPKPTGCHIAKP